MNKTLCRHIRLQTNCKWCQKYRQQKIKQCDRCFRTIYFDDVFLAQTGQRPQLICFICRVRDKALREA